jgi:hypothetical protein
MQMIAVANTPRKLSFTNVAFSPSGERLGCVAHTQVLVWDARTGELLRDFDAPGIVIHGGVAYPHDDFLLASNGARQGFLLDVENQLKLWQYDGSEQTVSAGGTAFFAVGDQRSPGALLAVEVPHKEALALLNEALKRSDLFVFQSGTPVDLDVSKVPGPQQSRVKEQLTAKLAEMDCTVTPGSDVKVIASVAGPKPREISYFRAGDYTVQEYISRLAFQHQGKDVWQTQGTNVPYFVTLKRGENIEGVLRKAGEQPNYNFFETVSLPKFLQRPSEGSGPQSRQTLGGSRVTPSGLQ